MPHLPSPRIKTQVVDLDPSTDFVIPMGLYQNDIDSDPLSLLEFPVQGSKGWELPQQWRGMYLKKVFYVLSPSLTPQPPMTSSIYTTERNYEPAGLTSVRALNDSFDLSRVQVSAQDNQHTDKLSKIFSAYNRPVEGTIPLYFYTRRTSEGNVLFVSLHETPPPGLDLDPVRDVVKIGIDWQPAKGGKALQSPTTRAVYVLEERPKGFDQINGTCIPGKLSNDTFQECIEKIPGNIQDLNQRHTNMVDEIIGLPNAPVYQRGAKGEEIARRIETTIRERGREPCPCPVDYREQLFLARKNKRAFLSALALAILFCLLIVVAVFIGSRQ